MTELLIKTTMYMSFVCAMMSAAVLLYFLTHLRHPLGRAVTFMLAGECLTMIAIAYYATMEYQGRVDQVSPETGSVMRILLLCVCAISTIHLGWQVSRILSAGNGGEGR